MKRYGAKVEDGVVTNVVVLQDGAKGDEALTVLGLVEEPGVVPGIGWSWDGSSFSPPPLLWQNIRDERDTLLAASDWTQVVDAPVDSAEWAVYRQMLRDIPQTYANPDEVVWPETPQ